MKILEINAIVGLHVLYLIKKDRESMEIIATKLGKKCKIFPAMFSDDTVITGDGRNFILLFMKANVCLTP